MKQTPTHPLARRVESRERGGEVAFRVGERGAEGRAQDRVGSLGASAATRDRETRKSKNDGNY